MDMSKLYQEVAAFEKEESVEGHGLDPVQVGQVCSIFMRRVERHTGLDIRSMLEGYPKNLDTSQYDEEGPPTA